MEKVRRRAGTFEDYAITATLFEDEVMAAIAEQLFIKCTQEDIDFLNDRGFVFENGRVMFRPY